ncbi:GH14017 [Drosophila grimshawi]|uniref:GH14017 n=2 Tax=Drosophila grimshawi TaxID=7222 RepID=B4JYG1_DROGR|nr:GH14017 [Drosophila grimshawi]
MLGAAHNDDNTFVPILPKDISPEFISRNVFTKAGQYRVFEPLESESDLRLTMAVRRKDYMQRVEQPMQPVQAVQLQNVKKPNASTRTIARQPGQRTTTMSLSTQPPSKLNSSSSALHDEVESLENLLMEYVEQFFTHGKYEPMPGLVLALQQNHSKPLRLQRSVVEDANVELNIPRALQSARLLFFAGLKKVMWPIYMGLQVLKSLLFALFLPTIIGSVSRLIGKGITTGSASSVPLFVRPMDPPQELDFRDNSVHFEDDNKFGMADDAKNNAGYEYNAEASQQQAQYAAFNPNSLNSATLSRYGGQQMQDTYLSALQSIGAASFKNSGSLSAGSSNGMAAPGMAKKPASPANMNTFQSFQKVPNSSLLLSNYDPFYSPLLSRLDSVFAQLKLNSENENCREKLICLMYSNPAKYAPYSNLVSAQLSRELNELRKPTSDNPDILRFFKYMRAAKDGQDGIDCEELFVKCKEFKDFENPAMLSTYNDINKLVQARKLA